MATAVIMPRQGQSVESCVIGQWHKKKGDTVSIDDVLFTYETDKATFEETAKVGGVLLEVFFEEGDDVECLKTVCVIGQPGEEPAERSEEQPVEQLAARPAPQLAEQPRAAAAPRPERIHISPRARILAQRTGADIGAAVPTGANNRVMSDDIERVIEQQGRFFAAQAEQTAPPMPAPAPVPTTAGERTDVGAALAPEFEEVKLSNVRRVIARAMHASLAESAQLTLHSSFDASEALAYRKKLKASDNEVLARITLTDIIVYAASRVLCHHKSANAHFLGERMALYRDAHIGLAVDTPRGLLVPTIFHANRRSLADISSHIKSLSEKCRQGAIEPDALKGATFTISNLGTMGVEMFTPVLNPPQTCILGVCSIVERTRQGQAYPAMGLSLTFDHRALDGADAARFLKDLAGYLENFSVYLAL